MQSNTTVTNRPTFVEVLTISFCWNYNLFRGCRLQWCWAALHYTQVLLLSCLPSLINWADTKRETPVGITRIILVIFNALILVFPTAPTDSVEYFTFFFFFWRAEQNQRSVGAAPQQQVMEKKQTKKSDIRAPQLSMHHLLQCIENNFPINTNYVAGTCQLCVFKSTF